jgi:hypothetical protein
MRAGLLAGREGEVLALRGGEARVAVGGLELTIARADLAPVA